MLVRALEAADLDEYRALMLEAFEVDADAFTSTRQEREQKASAWWLARMDHPHDLGRAFGAFQDGQMVGTVAIEYSDRFKTCHKGHVVGMYVRSALRGQGLAQALLAAVVADARARPSISVLTLTCTQGNERAQHLYASAGFEVFGVEPRAIFTGHDYKAKVHMHLSW
jgi:RimJ/RimL family protein N-acetyltransferase